MDPYKILKHSMMTEKNVGLVERENKIVFIVDRKAKKEEIKKAFEELFKVKVSGINTAITRKGKKKAFVRLSKEYPAVDVATKLGII